MTKVNFILFNRMKQIRLKNKCYLVRQDNTIHTFSIVLSFSSIGQDKSKLLQKHIIELHNVVESKVEMNPTHAMM